MDKADVAEVTTAYMRLGECRRQLAQWDAAHDAYSAAVGHASLIDDQAMSQSEHSGLIFEAYAGTTFIGSPTAGANGDITNALLPGGLRLTFSGRDVRHADGRQLQRIGLVPDVLVRPTIAGIRAGRDEVLDAATAWLKKKLGP